MNNTIDIFQKNWAFTSVDSGQPQIRTGSFGPCYVLTFSSPQFAAMAHVDDNTDVNSISVIFNKFSEYAIAPKDIKVIILGGWERNPESFKWGMHIVKKLTNQVVKT